MRDALTIEHRAVEVPDVETRSARTYKLQALDRAFAVLDLLGGSRTPLGLAQIAVSLKLHKSTAHRFLMVLERHRMVERTSAGKFRLGLRLFDYGNRAIEQFDLRDRALPHLKKLVAETEETAHLCVLERAHTVYLDKLEPPRSVRLTSRIGASNPVHCTAVGKAMLAHYDSEKVEEILKKTRFERLTAKTLGSREEFIKELERTRRRGYAVDDEECESGVRCVAMAVVDAHGQAVAAVSISGPSFRMTAQKIPLLASKVMNCVRGVAADMGYSPVTRSARPDTWL
jgi:DNA-binding IclR family transcriptional regulator